MENMIKISCLFLLLSLSSCGVFKKVFKKSDKFKEDTEIQVKKDEEVETIDKSKTTITEKVKTDVVTPAKKTEGETKVSNLADIQNLTVVADGLVTVRQTYDTLGKKLKTYVDLHPQVIPVDIDRTTTINNDVTTKTKAKIDSTNNKTIIKEHKEVKKEPKNIFWYVVLTLGVLAGLFWISKKYL